VISGPTEFMGVDVQVNRGCTWAVLDDSCRSVDCGWIEPDGPSEVAAKLAEIARRVAAGDRERLEMGIDAPRMPLSTPRHQQWTKGRWVTSEQLLAGRHCEVILRACGVANPQWTPLEAAANPWMQLCFAIFRAMSDAGIVREVFPSASYALLDGDRDADVTISLGSLKPGPIDMLDAYVAAFTVHEHVHGRGRAVGGGDGLGEIVLPRPIPHAPAGLLLWPDPNEGESIDLCVDTNTFGTCTVKGRRQPDGSWEVWGEFTSAEEPWKVDPDGFDLTRHVRSVRELTRAVGLCGNDLGFSPAVDHLEAVLPKIADVDPELATGLERYFANRTADAG